MGNDVFDFTPQSTFPAISKALGPGRMEGFPPILKQTALSKEQALQKEYQILSRLPFPVTIMDYHQQS